MTISLILAGRSETEIILNTANVAAGAASIDVQYGTTEDFQFCIAPLLSFNPQAQIYLGALNRGQTYYARARSIVPQFDFTGGALPAGATFKRNSVGTVINGNGYVQEVGVDVPRFDYDPNNHASRGILIEPAATNLIFRSVQMDLAPWGQAYPTVTAQGGYYSPDGSNSGVKLTDPDSSTSSWQQYVAVTPGQRYTRSFWLLADGVGRATRLPLFSAGSDYWAIETSTGQAVKMQGTGDSSIVVTSHNLPGANFWYVQITMTATEPQWFNHFFPAFYKTAAAGDPISGATISNAATGDIGVAFAQLEAGNGTSFIKTLGATATRAADVLTLNWAAKGLADGNYSVRYTFDDGSYQETSALVFGGVSVVPTTLKRSRIRAVALVGTGAEPWSPTFGFSTTQGVDTAGATSGVLIQPALLAVAQPILRLGDQGRGLDGYPADNLAVNSPMAAFRTKGLNRIYSVWAEHAGAPVDTIALLETNFPEAATIQIKAGDDIRMVDGSGMAPSYVTAPIAFRASANLSGRRGYHTFVRLPQPVQYRYILIEVNVGAVDLPGSIAHMTHLVLGRARVARNYSDLTDQGFDLSTTTRDQNGTLDLIKGFRGRKIDFEISAMTQTTYETMFGDLSRVAGYSVPVFIAPNTKSGPYLHDQLLYGLLTAGRQTNSNMRYTRNFSCESIIN